MILHFPEPPGHHGVMTFANTFDISSSVIKVWAGWRELLTFMVIKRVVGSALYVFDLISETELTMHCSLKCPGKWKGTWWNNKVEVMSDGGWGWGTKDWHSAAAGKQKETFVIPAITNRMEKKSVWGSTHDLLHKVVWAYSMSFRTSRQHTAKSSFQPPHIHTQEHLNPGHPAWCHTF